MFPSHDREAGEEVPSKKKLDDKGFEYLMEKGTHKDINVALNTREMTGEQATELKEKLDTLEEVVSNMKNEITK